MLGQSRVNFNQHFGPDAVQKTPPLGRPQPRQSATPTMAGMASSASQRLEEEDTSHLSAEERVAAARARHHRQQAIMAANSEADFALGEDAPQNATGRLAQESKWSSVNVDARTHFSVRELLQVQKPAILNSLVDFARVRTLLEAIEAKDGARDEARDGGSLLSRLTPELVELVIGHALPGQSPLVPALLSPTLRVRSSGVGGFRVIVRVRPLLEAEGAAGEYSAIDDEATERQQLVCHDARLARSGRRLSMIHHWCANATAPPGALALTPLRA